MKTILFLLSVVLFALTSPVQAQRYTNRYDTITTTDGSEYSRVSLKRKEGRSIVFLHSSGIEKVHVDSLPDHVLSDIGLPTRADRERAAREKAQFEAKQRKRKEAEKHRKQDTKKKPEVVSGITFREFDKVFNEKSSYTELQKQEAWKRFKGKRVQWRGVVGNVVGTSTGVNLVARMSDDLWGTGLLLIYLKSTERDKAMKLKENDKVTFRGTLRKRTVTGRIELGYGEIVEEVEKGASVRHEKLESTFLPEGEDAKIEQGKVREEVGH